MRGSDETAPWTELTDGNFGGNTKYENRINFASVCAPGETNPDMPPPVYVNEFDSSQTTWNITVYVNNGKQTISYSPL